MRALSTTLVFVGLQSPKWWCPPVCTDVPLSLKRKVSMDRYSIAAIASLVAVGAKLAIAVFLFSTGYDESDGSSLFLLLQVIGTLLSVVYFVAGGYLWLTGFTRYESWLKESFGRAILYFILPGLYATYIELSGRYEHADN